MILNFEDNMSIKYLEKSCIHFLMARWHSGREYPASAGDARDTGSISESGRSPGGGNDNPLQYSCLENLMGRGAWLATVHRATKGRTQLKQLNMRARTRFTKWHCVPGTVFGVTNINIMVKQISSIPALLKFSPVVQKK